MAVRGPVAVDERLGAGRPVDGPVDGHRLAAPRWSAAAKVAPCQAIAVPTAVVPPMPNPVVMAAVFATGARHGMAAGSAPVVEIDPATGLVIALPIDSESAQVSDQEIAPESGSEIVPVLSIEIRAPSVRRLRTIARVPGVFAIGTIVMAIAVAPGMNGVNRLNAPDRVMRMAAPSARRPHRRPQRPRRQRMI